MDAEENTVLVDALPDFLSSEEKDTLSQHLTQPEVLTEEAMIRNFAVAKTFVQSVYNEI